MKNIREQRESLLLRATKSKQQRARLTELRHIIELITIYNQKYDDQAKFDLICKPLELAIKISKRGRITLDNTEDIVNRITHHIIALDEEIADAAVEIGKLDTTTANKIAKMDANTMQNYSSQHVVLAALVALRHDIQTADQLTIACNPYQLTAGQIEYIISLLQSNGHDIVQKPIIVDKKCVYGYQLVSMITLERDPIFCEDWHSVINETDPVQALQIFKRLI